MNRIPYRVLEDPTIADPADLIRKYKKNGYFVVSLQNDRVYGLAQIRARLQADGNSELLSLLEPYFRPEQSLNGLPDIFVYKQGLDYSFIEVKRADDGLNAHQVAWFAATTLRSEIIYIQRGIKKQHGTRLRQVIEEIKALKKKNNLTPKQSRYVDKMVRQELNLQLPKEEKPLPDYLTPPEIYKILEVSQQGSALDGVMVEFQILTGLRINETRNLLIQHIDFAHNQLKVVRGKGAKDRYVPVSNNLLHKLKLFLNGRKLGYVFAKPNETAYSKRALQKRIEKIIGTCQFSKRLSTHSLRHTFACLCLVRGMRLEDIQLIMGHSSRKTTEIYAKLELGAVKEKYLQVMGSL